MAMHFVLGTGSSFWVVSGHATLDCHCILPLAPRPFRVGSCDFALTLQTDIGVSDHAALRHAALAMTLHFANGNFGTFRAPSCGLGGTTRFMFMQHCVI
jgi:hypothetical protein